MDEVKQKAVLENEKVNNVATAAKAYEETRRQYFENKLSGAEERRQSHINSKKDKATQAVAKVEQANTNKELEVSHREMLTCSAEHLRIVRGTAQGDRWQAGESMHCS